MARTKGKRSQEEAANQQKKVCVRQTASLRKLQSKNKRAVEAVQANDRNKRMDIRERYKALVQEEVQTMLQGHDVADIRAEVALCRANAEVGEASQPTMQASTSKHIVCSSMVGNRRKQVVKSTVYQAGQRDFRETKEREEAEKAREMEEAEGRANEVRERDEAQGTPRVVPTKKTARKRGRTGVESPTVPQDETGVQEDATGADVQQDGAGGHVGGRDELLKSYKDHIGDLIMLGGEGNVLKMKQHTTKLKGWSLDSECPEVQSRVKESPLHHLVDISYTNADRPLLSAFVERWQPETNTFHLPFGEMTITLEDIWHIARLPVQGNTIGRLKDESEDTIVEWCKELLGISEECIRGEMKQTGGKCVRMEWLRKHLEGLSMSGEPESVDWVVRGYLLYLLGCSIFSDRSGTQVSILYLHFLEDINGHGGFAWGAAALAYLYRQLGSASRKDAISMSGYLTVMQAWIYERFPEDTFGVDKVEVFEFSNPRAARWITSGRKTQKFAIQCLKEYRALIDELKKEEVNWRVYPEDVAVGEIVWFNGCLRAVDVTEPYHPLRVARQLGHVQVVPRAPLLPAKCNRTKASFKVYKVKHEERECNYENWDDHVIMVHNRGLVAEVPHACSSNYEEWYTSHSYPKLNAHERGGLEAIPSREVRIFSRVKGYLEGAIAAKGKQWKDGVRDALNLINSTVFAKQAQPMEDDEN